MNLACVRRRQNIAQLHRSALYEAAVLCAAEIAPIIGRFGRPNLADWAGRGVVGWATSGCDCDPGWGDCSAKNSVQFERIATGDYFFIIGGSYKEVIAVVYARFVRK